MNKKHIIFVVIILLSLPALAQQLHLNSLGTTDKFYINPAAAGSEGSINSFLNYRKQFIGIEGAPTTTIFAVHAPLQKEYMGLGLKFIKDDIAVSEQTTIMAAYAYQLGFGQGKLALGLEIGCFIHSIDFSSLVIGEDIYDGSIPDGTKKVVVPDASFGIYYFADKFNIGYSNYHLLKSKLNNYNKDVNDVASLYMHHLLTVGYKFPVGENLKILPSSVVRIVSGAPTQADIMCLFSFKDLVSVGALYRSGDALAAILKISINERFIVGYSYDYTLSDLSNHINGGHEIMLSYKHKLLPPASEKEVHPIYYLQ